MTRGKGGGGGGGAAARGARRRNEQRHRQIGLDGAPRGDEAGRNTSMEGRAAPGPVLVMRESLGTHMLQ